MNKIDRYKILIRYIVDNGTATSQKHLASLLGYTNESSFSQIINGKVREPKDFIQKIKIIVPSLNAQWLLTGEGEMLNDGVSISQHNEHGDNIAGKTVTVSRDADKLIEIIADQSRQLGKSQEMMERLIALLEKK